MASVDKQDAIEKLRELVGEYEKVRDNGKLGQFSEADVGSKYILPLLEILGWDTRNIDEVKEQRITLSGPVDYSLAINRKPRLVVELKKFAEDLDGYREVHGRRETFPEQATRYAWHLKLEWVVLTNFKEIRLYNSYYKKPADGLRFQISYEEFISRSDELWLLSKQSVGASQLDRIERKAERKNIDEAVLEDLLEIRRIISENISAKNHSLTKEDVRDSVQKIMDRLLVIRVAEDRGVIGFESLYKQLDAWKSRSLPTPFMRSLKTIFRDFDEVYNTKLFEPHLCEDLALDNQGLETAISILYRYNFDLISADVLGAIYEDYIGHILEDTTAGGVQIAESRETRKKGGIYYTPAHLVEYVVRDTLGELLKNCKSPEEVSRIKVLDPACGSGSFLIKAFDIIKEWYEDYNRKLNSKGNSLEVHFQAVTDIERKILKESLFGVDIDPQAAEIASVNLMLKALRQGQKLPQILGQNIKVGNSLVNGSEEGFNEVSDEAKQGLRPLSWEAEFSEIFASGGFDVVIGNPPYFKVRKDNPIRISPDFEAVKTGPINAAMMFINRSTELAKKGGSVGLVLPKMLTYTKGWNGSRRKVFSTKIRSVINCQEAFEGVLLEQILLTLEKREPEKSYSYRVGEAKGLIITSPASISQSLAEREDYVFLEPEAIAYKIRENMLQNVKPLGGICDIILGEGIQSYPCWHETQQPGDLRILRGDDIQMWHIRGCLYFSPDAPEMVQFKNEISKLSTPHIVAQRIIAHIRHPKPHIILMAAHDKQGAFAFNTVGHFIVTDDDYDYRYILALLNSKLFSYYAYKFIYNNAVRSMDFYKDYAERLPVKKIKPDQQKLLNGVADAIIQHFEKPGRYAPHYRKYLTERIVDHEEFNEYYRKLSPNDREPKDTEKEGVIRRLQVSEEADWLVFKVDYLDPKLRRVITDHQVLRCRVQDRYLRTFLLIEINNKGPNNKGKRLLDKILAIRLPLFHKSSDRHLEAIHKQLKSYLIDFNTHKKWESEYADLDDRLNRKVYEIYGLDTEEIEYVEKNSRPTGWHSDSA